MFTDKVCRVSSVTKDGLKELWDEMEDFKDTMLEKEQFHLRRSKQRKVWMWNHISEHIVDAFKNHPEVRQHINDVENSVISGEVMPGNAADYLMAKFLRK